MEYTQLLIRTAFLALPGILGRSLYRMLARRVSRKNWEDFTEILLFSLASYAIYGVISQPFGMRLTVFGALSDRTSPLNWYEILWASLIGMALAAGASYLHTHKVVTGIGRFVGITNRFGDDDVWEYLFNSPQVEWVFVRDHRRDLVYFGRVRAWSDPEQPRELLITDVHVFRNDNGEKIYEIPLMYVSRPAEDMTIEIPRPSPQNVGDTARSAQHGITATIRRFFGRIF
jgi:hypothetical protein